MTDAQMPTPTTALEYESTIVTAVELIHAAPSFATYRGGSVEAGAG